MLYRLSNSTAAGLKKTWFEDKNYLKTDQQDSVGPPGEGVVEAEVLLARAGAGVVQSRRGREVDQRRRRRRR